MVNLIPPGGALVFEFEQSICDVLAFQLRLQRFLKKFEYGNFNHSDLWSVLTQVFIRFFLVFQIRAETLVSKYRGFPLYKNTLYIRF